MVKPLCVMILFSKDKNYAVHETRTQMYLQILQYYRRTFNKHSSKSHRKILLKAFHSLAFQIRSHHILLN